MDWADSQILETVRLGGAVASLAAERTKLTRVTISRRLARLAAQGYVRKSGSGTRPRYSLGQRRWWQGLWPRAQLRGDMESAIWAAHVAPLLESAAPNVRNIAHTGFTEILNNAIDHSQARTVCACVHVDQAALQMAIMDDGVGAFARIARHLHLADRRLAVLELSKGKLTTAASGHSGIGIFVSSRFFDRFTLRSDGLVFTHSGDFQFDWLDDAGYRRGTVVLMEIALDSPRTAMSVYERYFDPSQTGGGAFRLTEVPVRLAALGQELVSRSQGKWVTARIDQFERVILDFSGIATVGQGFVDEVFRVFANAHPQVRLIPENMAPEVARTVDMFAPLMKK